MGSRPPFASRRAAVLARLTRLSDGQRAATFNAGWLAVERAIRLVLSLTIGAWVARYLTPDRYGQLALALSVVALITPLSKVGLDSVVVNRVLRAHQDRQRVLADAFMVKVVASLLAFATVVVLSALLPSLSGSVGVAIAVGSSLLWSPSEVVQFDLEARLKGRRLVTARVAAGIVAAGLNVFWIVRGAGVVAFAWTVSAEAALRAAFLAAPLWSSWSVGVPRGRWRPVASLLRESWPLAITSLSVLIYMKIDVVMLNAMKGSAAVGVYAAATRISELWYFVPTAIVTSVTPAVLRARARGASDYRRALGALLEGLGALAVGVAVLTTVVAGPVVHVLFGPSYAGAATVLQIHVWAAVFVFLGHGQALYMVSERLNRLSLVQSLVGSGLNVGLNLLLIPGLGVLGAALATLISYSVPGVAGNALFPATRPILRLQLEAFRMKNLRTMLRGQ